MKANRNPLLAAWLIAAVAVAGTSWAQIAMDVPTTTTPPSTGSDAPTADIIPLQTTEGIAMEAQPTAGANLINVTVENETLENVVNMFARISGANIVTTSADLEGTVTVSLRDVEWKPALSAILDVHELALVEKLPGSAVYSIVPKPPDASEPLVVESVFLNFTTVPDIGPIAESMLVAVTNASVKQFAARNALVIRTTESNMREIKDLITEMDVPGDQVVVETKFMELNDSASKKIGIRWDSLDEWGMKLGLGPLSYDRTVDRVAGRENSQSFNNNRVRTDLQSSTDVIDDQENSGFRPNGDQIEDLSFDIFDPTPADPLNNDEVVIQRFEPTLTRNGQNRTESSSSDSRTITEDFTANAMDTFSKSVSEAQAAVLDVGTFDFILSALLKTDGVTMISNPKIIVASGQEDAYFTVGDREPIIKSEVQRGTTESPGDVITAELDTSINTDYIKDGYLKTGIHLTVVPTVKTEDLIEANIAPQLVRRVLPDKIVGNNSWPRIAVKEISTTFTLRSGQTVAIGGLTDTADEKRVSKVPLLGDIPLLGKYLFSHTEDLKKQTETIIFVTLSLAEAESLFEEAGIPENARIVHKKLIQNREEREVFEAELEKLRKAQDAASAERARNRLLNIEE